MRSSLDYRKQIMMSIRKRRLLGGSEPENHVACGHRHRSHRDRLSSLGVPLPRKNYDKKCSRISVSIELKPVPEGTGFFDFISQFVEP